MASYRADHCAMFLRGPKHVRRSMRFQAKRLRADAAMGISDRVVGQAVMKGGAGRLIVPPAGEMPKTFASLRRERRQPVFHRQEQHFRSPHATGRGVDQLRNTSSVHHFSAPVQRSKAISDLDSQEALAISKSPCTIGAGTVTPMLDVIPKIDLPTRFAVVGQGVQAVMAKTDIHAKFIHHWRGGGVAVPTCSAMASAALRSFRDEALRQRILPFVALTHTACSLNCE